MAENEKPPAPPAETDTSVPAPTPAPAPEPPARKVIALADLAAHASRDDEGDGVDEDEGVDEEEGVEPQSVYDLVREHAGVSHKDHPTVHEFAALRGLSRVDVFNPQTAQMESHACWQVKALLARFRQHGLHDGARVPHDVLELALHEALHGRV